MVQTEPVTGSQVTSSGSSLPAPRVSKLVTTSSLLPKRVSGPAATSNTSRLLSSETSRWWVADVAHPGGLVGPRLGDAVPGLHAGPRGLEEVDAREDRHLLDLPVADDEAVEVRQVADAGGSGLGGANVEVATVRTSDAAHGQTLGDEARSPGRPRRPGPASCRCRRRRRRGSWPSGGRSGRPDGAMARPVTARRWTAPQVVAPGDGPVPAHARAGCRVSRS